MKDALRGWLVLAIVIAIGWIIYVNSSKSQILGNSYEIVPSPTSITIITPTSVPTEANYGLSNNNYYINSSGNEVHSPAYSNSIPVGATAQCVDGTYSFSQHRRGTCSHHGGVAQWL